MPGNLLRHALSVLAAAARWPATVLPVNPNLLMRVGLRCGMPPFPTPLAEVEDRDDRHPDSVRARCHR